MPMNWMRQAEILAVSQLARGVVIVAVVVVMCAFGVVVMVVCMCLWVPARASGFLPGS